MTDWVRLWHDMPTDPKWRVIARKAGQPLANVISLFTLMLVNASAASPRGSLAGWDNEDAAAALDMEESDVAAIYTAMQGKVLDGDRLTGWDRRQPKREDASAERVKRHRNAVKRNVTRCNAPDTDTEKDTEENPPSPPFGLDEAMDAWNEMAERAGVPKVRGLNDQRRTWFAERLAEHGEAGIREAIAAVERSSFCRGRNDRKWRADFGFMIQAKSFLKLIEGSFADEPSATPAPTVALTAEEHDQRARFFRSIGRDDQAKDHERRAAQLRRHDEPSDPKVARIIAKTASAIRASA